MMNIPKVKVGIVAVSRDCFPESLSVNRRRALVEAYQKKYDGEDIYECPVDRKSTRLNSSHGSESRMPSSA